MLSVFIAMSFLYIYRIATITVVKHQRNTTHMDPVSRPRIWHAASWLTDADEFYAASIKIGTERQDILMLYGPEQFGWENKVWKFVSQGYWHQMP